MLTGARAGEGEGERRPARTQPPEITADDIGGKFKTPDGRVCTIALVALVGRRSAGLGTSEEAGVTVTADDGVLIATGRIARGGSAGTLEISLSPSPPAATVAATVTAVPVLTPVHIVVDVDYRYTAYTISLVWSTSLPRGTWGVWSAPFRNGQRWLDNP